MNQPLAKPQPAATGEPTVQRGHAFVRLLGTAWVEYERDRAGYLTAGYLRISPGSGWIISVIW